MPDARFDVVELRRYVTASAKRDTLIALFERVFIEGQEACGMVPVGHFRDRDDPDGFVWFRGFEATATRRAALEAFYRESQAWKDHRTEANDTLVDSDNVLLLRDARPGSGFDLDGLARPAGTESGARSSVGVAVFMLERPAGDAFVSAFETELLPRVREHARRVAYLDTDPRPNEFPALPVREGEYAFVVTAVCRDDDALAQWTRLVTSDLPASMQSQIRRRELLRLEPAARSLYGNEPAASPALAT